MTLLLGCTWIPAEDLAARLSACGDEVWYDGVDGDCDGGSDYDQDGDGYDALLYGGDDCWDDPTSVPAAWVALNGLTQPQAADVHPGAEDAWYDAVDADCDGGGDFDQDGDGADAEGRARRDGTEGDDCYDSVEDDLPPGAESACDGTGEVLEPAEVYPGAEDAWYDGTDADCAGDSDFDQDGDGYDVCEECDDEHSDDEMPAETWYDGVDDNCDGNDGDQDGDGFYWEAYAFEVPASFGSGDCWDDPTSIPEDYVTLQGSQPSSAEVCPGASDAWYDAVDQDCDGASDFDQDGDGQDASDHADRDGAIGEDCDDTDSTVYAGATDAWYDGVDGDCGGEDDFDQDGDGWIEAEDCDDTDAAASPGAVETCATSGDDDCDGGTDDASDCNAGFSDADGDGHGSTVASCVCTPGAGWAATSDDCDDGDASVSPSAAETVGDGVDQDCDGGDTCPADDDGDGQAGADTVASGDLDCDDPGEAATTGDCDDALATVYLGAAEVPGDGVDQDCDGGESCWADVDGDGDGSGTAVASSDLDCDDAGESASDDGDCDDGDASVGPGAVEVVDDGIDQDCDGGDACWADADGDGEAGIDGAASADLDCDDPGEASAAGADCDDGDPTVLPGATEVIGDGADQDCDGVETCYADGDGDGVRTDDTVASADGDCDDAGEALASADDGDCDDDAASVTPGATEVVDDGIDQDCDGVDACYVDADADGYRGTSGTTMDADDLDCADAGEGAATDPATDCDDSTAATNPGATEIVADAVDQDCDNGDTCYADADSDGYRSATTTSTVASLDLDCSDTGEGAAAEPATDCDDSSSTVNPGAGETVADGVDQDCDGGDSCYVDSDDDGYRRTTGISADSADLDCTDSGEAVSTDPATDCNDGSASVNPGATETVDDAIDQDCSGGDACYVDADSDGYRSMTTSLRVASTDLDCADAGEGASAEPATDCDDASSAINPGATETVGDELDSDCDNEEICYADDDQDGYGDEDGTTVVSNDADCDEPDEASSSDPLTDCDDADADVNPGEAEVCEDGLDNDCSGDVTECGLWGYDTVSGADHTWNGGLTSDYVGSAVALGDVDADGWDDVIVASYGYDSGSTSAVGRVYVFSGPTTGGSTGVTSADYTITGESASDQIGIYRTAITIRDADDDGDDELLVGSPFDDGAAASSGAAYLFLGGTGFSSTTPSSAFASFASTAVSDYGGYAIADAGDIDDDGLADMLVCAYLFDAGGVSNAGVAALFYGADVTGGSYTIGTDYGVLVAGTGTNQYTGKGLAGAGDVDADGVDDFVVGAYGADTGATDAGAAYLVLGGTGTTYYTPSTVDGVVNGVENSDYLGLYLAGLGDSDGDGYDEWAIGAYNADDASGASTGRVYVFSDVSGTVSASTADAILDGEASGDEAGAPVAGPGDVDGDGRADLLVAAGSNDGAASAGGAVYLVYGPIVSMDLGDADAYWYGTTASDVLGYALGEAGDADGDGYDDVIFGTPFYDPASVSSGGSAWLWFGSGI